MGAKERSHLLSGLSDLPGLRRDDDHIHGAGPSGIFEDNCRTDCEIAVYALDPQATFGDGCAVRSPGNEDHLLPGLRQAAAEVASHATRAEDRNLHGSP
jgi:hypothetical protein